jgi:colanic acid biosynthesis glycosyl transferase WcaI
LANVLILSLVFPPDSVSTAQIMGELGTDLESQGHKVTVITTSPHYNQDAEAESRQPIQNYWGSVLRKSDYHGIHVYHTFMPRKGKNIFLRLLAWGGFHQISIVAGMATVPRPDVILTPSPPLTIGVCAWILGKYHRTPFIYNVQEVYPDIAVRLGAIRNKWLIGRLQQLESFVYRKAKKITVIAPRMRQRLLEKGVPSGKVEVVPNFVDIGDLSPLPKDNGFSRPHGIHEKFVISYAGNMGPAQGLESFIEAAFLLRGEQGIHFMMMGDGILRKSLVERVAQSGLGNFLFLAHQPYSMMPSIYAASDVCLVPQAMETGCDAVPSKVYRIMACARPVLATTDPESDLAILIKDAGCGAIVPPGSPSDLAGVIWEAYRDRARWREMGRAGRTHVVEHYSRHVVTGRYHALIQAVANGGR